MKNKEIKPEFYANIYELPALNWLFFELYYSLHQHTFSKTLRKDMDFLIKLKGLAGAKKEKELVKMIDNQYASLAREQQGEIPYLYLAYDCLLKKVNKTISDFQSEINSYSYSNEPLESCKDVVEIAFDFFNEELEKNFYESPLFNRKRKQDKMIFLRRIKKLASLDFEKGDVEEYAFEVLTMFLQDSNIPEMINFKASYLRNIGFSLDALNLASLNNLGEISVYDYYSTLSRRHEEYLAQKKALENK